ncbi:MAG: hypothetical protein EOP10_18355 [Proteobacteria bacterium]|nr:MAG: hypothetical protein EOP10_18355 [Pseudomonadota bacterium]
MQRFLKSVIAAFVSSLLVLPASAQVSPDPQQFRVFDTRAEPVSLLQLLEWCQQADVVFWGEEHDDAVGHALQANFFGQLIAKYQPTRQVALSLEMFERDTQVVLDEYLSGQITEKHFLDSSRPWQNYSKDYKPLIMLAKENQLPIIASNAPRRYVNMVTRQGPKALEKLSPMGKTWLAPLPYPPASASYARKFGALMGAGGGTTGSGASPHTNYLLDSQALWDATMADSLSRFLKMHGQGARKPAKRPLVLHLSGRFHSEQKLGTVEQFLRLQPQAKVCVVTVVSDPTFEARKHSGLGDFVILTAPEVKEKANP